MKIKGWEKFQHFKDRRPPWIKLYRDILDDIEWHNLDGEAAKVLVMLWLLASEHEGELPAIAEIAFRLRLPETRVKSIVSKLSHWLIQDDIAMISQEHQDDSPRALARDRDRDREETEGKGGSGDPPSTKSDSKKSSEYSADFERAWKLYPKRSGKNDKRLAWRAWQARVKTTHLAWLESDIMAGVKRYAAYIDATGKTGTEFVMQASTFFGPADPPNWENDWTPPKKTNGELKRDLRNMDDEAFMALCKRYKVTTYGLSTEKLIPMLQAAMDRAENIPPTVDLRLK